MDLRFNLQLDHQLIDLVKLLESAIKEGNAETVYGYKAVEFANGHFYIAIAPALAVNEFIEAFIGFVKGEEKPEK